MSFGIESFVYQMESGWVVRGVKIRFWGGGQQNEKRVLVQRQNSIQQFYLNAQTQDRLLALIYVTDQQCLQFPEYFLSFLCATNFTLFSGD